MTSKLQIKIITNRKDPDKRDYFVSNKKIEKKGFKAKVSLDQGVEELKDLLENFENKIPNPCAKAKNWLLDRFSTLPEPISGSRTPKPTCCCLGYFYGLCP